MTAIDWKLVYWKCDKQMSCDKQLSDKQMSWNEIFNRNTITIEMPCVFTLTHQKPAYQCIARLTKQNIMHDEHSQYAASNGDLFIILAKTSQF